MRLSQILPALLALLPFCTRVGGGTAVRGRVLVLIEDLAQSSQFDQYLQSVREIGYDLDRRSAADKDLRLRNWDDWLYDKLIILAAGVQAFGGALDTEAILDFVDTGHDVVLAVDSSASEEVRNLASDLGVDFEPRGSAVIDATDHVIMDHGSDPSLVYSDAILADTPIFRPDSAKDPVLFRGIGATSAPENDQVLQALGGHRSHVMTNPLKPFADKLQRAGKGISLVSLVQTRSDARVAVCGSLDMFTNDFLQATAMTTREGRKLARSGNAEFLLDLTKWVFHEKSVLRAGDLRHHPPGDEQQPARYRITDPVEFEIDIHEFKDGSWQPYSYALTGLAAQVQAVTGSRVHPASLSTFSRRALDVQLEFVMLDPHIRTFLSHDGTGRYRASFKIPDVYGIFKFVIDYRRPGLTHLEVAQQISVRHFRHNEFERFIPAAYPYYASGFSCMAGFFIFGFAFLYHRDK